MKRFENLTEYQKFQLSKQSFIQEVAAISYQCFIEGIEETEFWKKHIDLDWLGSKNSPEAFTTINKAITKTT